MPVARVGRFSDSSCYQLHRLVTELTKTAERELRAASGMSFSQFLVLQALLEKGELNQAEISDYVGVTPAVMTKQVDYLSAAGWLVRKHSTTDRRQQVISLSARGRQLAEQLSRQILDEVETTVAESLLPHYRDKLSDLLAEWR